MKAMSWNEAENGAQDHRKVPPRVLRHDHHGHHDAGDERYLCMVKIREKSNVPVILLTAKSEDTDKILGLTVGADDYVTKPFNPVELQARVKSQLRRYINLGDVEHAAGGSGINLRWAHV